MSARLVVSAAGTGAGKTLVATALCDTWFRVAAYKTGPAIARSTGASRTRATAPAFAPSSDRGVCARLAWVIARTSRSP